MLSDSVKKAVAVTLSAILLGAGYYGSYLPMRKSQAFISVLRNTGNLHTLEDFQNAYQSVFSMPSPIGEEELVRNLASTAVNVVSKAPNPSVVSFLVKFVDDAYQPILDRGRGMSFTQNIYVLGNLHQAAFVKTHDPQYLAAAKDFYLQGLELAPQRPQFLYGLLDAYRLQGDTAHVLEIRDKILALWPGDDRVQAAVQAYLDLQTTSSAPAKSGTKTK